MLLLMSIFIRKPFWIKVRPVLQIREGKRDNLGIVFHIVATQLKYVATYHQNCLAQMILMSSHNMFSLRNKNIFELSSISSLICSSDRLKLHITT